MEHKYSVYQRNGVDVCYLCDPLSNSNSHRPAVKDWLDGKTTWYSCEDIKIPHSDPDLKIVSDHDIFFRLEISKSGKLCLWEEGGGQTNTGNAIIVANKDGNPKPAIYVKRKGHLAGGRHALIPVKIGDIIISGNHHRGDFSICIFEIKSFGINGKNIFDKVGLVAICERVATFSEGEWSIAEVAEKYKDAVDALIAKATCYHCRKPHFIKNSRSYSR